MYDATPPPSPYRVSPPATPRSGVPLLLQSANRASRSPSRSPTYHRAPPPDIPLDSGSSLSFGPPPPLSRSPFHSPRHVPLPHSSVALASPAQSCHQRIASHVPRYALEDIVVPETLTTTPAYQHYRARSDTMTYYETSETNLVVNKEGFLEDEVKPIRGFWSRWLRAMIILLVFLSIVTGVAIGLSEYSDSKSHEAGTTDDHASLLTASLLPTITPSGLSSVDPLSTPVTSTGDSTSSGSSRMRTAVRTTSGATSIEGRITSSTTSATHTQPTEIYTTTALPTPSASASHGASASMVDSDAADPTSDSSEDPDEDVTSISGSPDPTASGRLFGLASTTGMRR
ncbi:hypothetical protein JCM16303_004619 [Sporobolomyces ruberrimus]